MRTTIARASCRRALACLLVLPCCLAAGPVNRLSDREKKQGFRLLFDGKSMDQWRNYRPKAPGIKPQWKIIDEAMVMTAKGGRDLITREKFRFFELRLEYTIAEKGNSGIMFRVVEQAGEQKAWRLAPEYQLYDSYNVKVRGDRRAGALYGLVAAPEGISRKPGQWNQVRILLEPAGGKTQRLRFWLNGRQTVDIVADPAPESRWSKLLDSRKPRGHFAEGFFRAPEGHILLQDHGARVAFRRIRLRQIDEKGKARTPREKTRSGTKGAVGLRVAHGFSRGMRE